MDKRTYLKVKIKSLAAEARIIRKEEKRARRSSIRIGLEEHRRGVVRVVSRHTHLAYGFIRGRTYKQLESSARELPTWSKIKAMVEKYGTEYVPDLETWAQYQVRKKDLMNKFEQWKEEGACKTEESSS